MKRYSIVAKAQKISPTNNTNVSWAGGQVDASFMYYSHIGTAISIGRRLAKECGYKVGEIRIADNYDDLPFESAKAFEFSGERVLIQEDK